MMEWSPLVIGALLMIARLALTARVPSRSLSSRGPLEPVLRSGGSKARSTLAHKCEDIIFLGMFLVYPACSRVVFRMLNAELCESFHTGLDPQM